MDNKVLNLLWLSTFLLLSTIAIQSCNKRSVSLKSTPLSIQWVQTDYGYKEYIDNSKNEFWLFGPVELCQTEVNQLVGDIDNLKKKARKHIELDYQSGQIVKDFISFHQAELGLEKSHQGLWELIKPVNRNSIHPEEGCTDPNFLIMDFEFIQSTNYVLGVYFNAQGEITHFDMES